MTTNLLSQLIRQDRPIQRTPLIIPANPGRFESCQLATSDRVVRTYLPSQYERNYAYPLVVFFHANGSNEEAALGFAPILSDRNSIAIALRAPRTLGLNHDGLPSFTWDDASTDDVEESVLDAIAHVRRQHHIHSERIYFAGLGDGARMAYRVGFRLADRIAGIAALNGPFPTADADRPLFRLPQARKLKIFIGHGIENAHCPLAQADRAYRLMYAAGTNVRFHKYPTDRDIAVDMLRDVNRWIIGNLQAETDQLILTR
jgi:phospholipase/carboxylesterase